MTESNAPRDEERAAPEPPGDEVELGDIEPSERDQSQVSGGRTGIAEGDGG
jgi:hypothetical protein